MVTDSTELPAPVGAGAYNVYTGIAQADAGGVSVSTAAQLGLEPPRFCAACGRRMIVQVSPHGWTARCSRHGEFDSSSGER